MEVEWWNGGMVEWWNGGMGVDEWWKGGGMEVEWWNGHGGMEVGGSGKTREQEQGRRQNTRHIAQAQAHTIKVNVWVQ